LDKSNPIESYAVHKETAEYFANSKNWGGKPPNGSVIEVKVPIEKIFSLPGVGIGDKSIGEVTVLSGGASKAKVVKRL
jgi:hypothetical protein